MNLEESIEQAAKAADQAVAASIKKYASGNISDEPEISAYLISQLDSHLNNKTVGGLFWSSTIVRNSKGHAAEEKRTGADILMHVSLDTPSLRYSKGVLIQAKRSQPKKLITQTQLEKLNGQCDTMLSRTSAAFVFSYSRQDLRVGSATRFSGTKQRDIHRQCTWTSYRFFLEFFRCMVGDVEISSSKVADLRPPETIYLSAKGDL